MISAQSPGKRAEPESDRNWREWLPAIILSASIPFVAASSYRSEIVWSKQTASLFFLLLALCASLPLLKEKRLRDFLSADASILLLLVLWAGLSALWAEVPSKSFKTATMLTTLVVGFGLSRLVLKHCGLVWLFLTGSLAAGSLAAAYGILQHHLDRGFFAMPLDGTGIKDASSSFGLSNFTVDVLVLILPLGLGLFLANRGKLRGLIGGLCFLTISYYVAVSQVRAGYMALLAMAGFFAFVTFLFRKEAVFVHRHSLLLVLVVSLLVGGLFLGLTRPGKNVLTSFVSSFDPQHPTIMIRLHTWQQAIRMIGEYSLAGVGLGNYEVLTCPQERVHPLS